MKKNPLALRACIIWIKVGGRGFHFVHGKFIFKKCWKFLVFRSLALALFYSYYSYLVSEVRFHGLRTPLEKSWLRACMLITIRSVSPDVLQNKMFLEINSILNLIWFFFSLCIVQFYYLFHLKLTTLISYKKYTKCHAFKCILPTI